MKTIRMMKHALAFGIAVTVLLGISRNASADIVSFLVDPATIDANMDGFITGSEFQPVGSDGTVFDLLPTNNLTGSDRFQLSDTIGLRYGGGGGSTLSFDFSVSKDISLESYTLATATSFINNPTFRILDGATVLSSTNTSNSSGDTHNFNGGPLNLSSGTIYSFETEVSGAAIQAYMESWTYTAAVPEPSSFGLVSLAGLTVLAKRRRRS